MTCWQLARTRMQAKRLSAFLIWLLRACSKSWMHPQQQAQRLKLGSRPKQRSRHQRRRLC